MTKRSLAKIDPVDKSPPRTFSKIRRLARKKLITFENSKLGKGAFPELCFVGQSSI
jgi:hypothetical protein